MFDEFDGNGEEPAFTGRRPKKKKAKKKTDYRKR